MKWVQSKRRREKKKERRANDGNNNGQAMHGARKHSVAHKPPGLKEVLALLTGAPGDLDRTLGVGYLFSINLLVVLRKGGILTIIFLGTPGVGGTQEERMEGRKKKGRQLPQPRAT